MAKLFKALVVICILVVVLIGAVFIFRNRIVKLAVSTGVKKITGLKLDIANLNVGIPETIISIEGMQLYNPPGYVDKIMVDMPEIYVDYNLAAILKNDIHLKEVRINLREMIIVKTKDGGLNFDSLKVVKSAEEEQVVVKEDGPGEKKKTRFRIDHLKLKIGRVVYKDYFSGSKPSIKEYNLNIDESYDNITDPQALARLILVRALINTNIASFKIKNLQGLTANTLNMTIGELEGGVKQGVGIGETLGGSAKDITEKAGQAIKSIFNLGE
ncbi:MAG: AsmA family protein [Candidatus Kaelpia aquatica]|nr:AsmA family protein [Candidatus Kaelpia aquatica]